MCAVTEVVAVPARSFRMTPVGWIFPELSHYLNPAALWEPINNKPSQGKLRGLAVVETGTVLLHPDHITCLKALRPF